MDHQRAILCPKGFAKIGKQKGFRARSGERQKDRLVCRTTPYGKFI